MYLLFSVVNDLGEKFEGVAQGHITLTVQSPAGPKETEARNSSVSFPVRVKIIARPPRQKRILWDQYHSLRYPPGYLPRDNLKTKSDPLDWRADHIHTNFKDMYTHLRNAGYYVEVLGEPFTCFNAANYGTLLIVDPEEEYFDAEMTKLRDDILEKNLSVIVFADWYNANVMRKIQFYDENTRQWWMPDTGGANVPALNELLGEFGIAFGDLVAEGYFSMGDHGMYYASGTSLIRFPQTNQSILIERELNNQGAELLNADQKTKVKSSVPILGMLQTSKLAMNKNALNAKMYEYKVESENSVFDAVEPEVQKSADKNPIINKRILLGQQVPSNNDFANNEVGLDVEADRGQGLDDIDTNNTERVQVVEVPQSMLLRNMETIKVRPLPVEQQPSATEGRIVVYGDSNCLDSTHVEKPCFWLLDALLEYTMTSHVSTLLRDLNRSSSIRFDAEPIEMPKRLPNNNLHLYSKVLTLIDPGGGGASVVAKRDNPTCVDLKWETPIYLNVTAPNDLQYQNGKDIDESDADGAAGIAMNLRRKLESQKGEVRSVSVNFNPFYNSLIIIRSDPHPANLIS